MHELSIAQAIAEQVEGVVAQHGLRATGAHVRVGALSGVDAGALESAFSLLAEGGSMSGVKLFVQHVPARVTCAGCSRTGDMELARWICSFCDGTDLTVIGGRELTLDSVDMWEEEHV